MSDQYGPGGGQWHQPPVDPNQAHYPGPPQNPQPGPYPQDPTAPSDWAPQDPGYGPGPEHGPGPDPVYGPDPRYGQGPGPEPAYGPDPGYGSEPGYGPGPGPEPAYGAGPSYGQGPGPDPTYGQDPAYGPGPTLPGQGQGEGLGTASNPSATSYPSATYPDSGPNAASYPSASYPASGPSASSYASAASYPSTSPPATWQGASPKDKKKGRKLPILLAAGVGALVLALVAGFLIWRANSSTVAGGGGKPPPSGSAGAVQGFLEALAAGDADKALTFTPGPTPDKTFLTSEVVAESNRLAALTDIQVAEGTKANEVLASYKIGDKQVSEARYQTRKDGDKFVVTSFVVSVSTYGMRGLLPKINGVQLSEQPTRILLFPGAYNFESGVEVLTYGTPPIIVESPTDATELPDQIKLAVTEEGQRRAIELTLERLTSCMRTKKTSTECWTITVSNGTFDEGKVRYTPDKEATVKEANVRLGPGAVVFVRPARPYKVFVSGPGILKGKRVPSFSLVNPISIAYFEVDFTKSPVFVKLNCGPICD